MGVLWGLHLQSSDSMLQRTVTVLSTTFFLIRESNCGWMVGYFLLVESMIDGFVGQWIALTSKKGAQFFFFLSTKGFVLL